MGRYLTAEEIEHECLEAMGSDLGRVYYRLENECLWLHLKWSDYTILFGTKQQRIELLNSAAPAFFNLIQDTMWENLLVHICRLMDPPKSHGKPNLTLQCLPQLVNLEARPDVEKHLEFAKSRCAFASDWRNRRIAHRDLGLALKEAEPLAAASRIKVKDALESIGAVLNAVKLRYTGSTASYDPIFSGRGNAMSLLHVLRDGVQARAAKRGRLISGSPTPDDLEAQPDI